MKKLLFIIIFFITTLSYSQIVTSEGIRIDVKKVKLVNNNSMFRYTNLKVDSKILRKIYIRVKIKAKNENKAKVSAFYLIDRDNKIRYRLADFYAYACPVGCTPYSPVYRKSELLDHKGKPIDHGPIVNKSVKDYFNDYDIDDYTNIEIPVNFAKKGKPEKFSIIYFGEVRTKNVNGELYFTVPRQNLNAKYELYYKDEKISNVKL